MLVSAGAARTYTTILSAYDRCLAQISMSVDCLESELLRTIGTEIAMSMMLKRMEMNCIAASCE